MKCPAWQVVTHLCFHHVEPPCAPCEVGGPGPASDAIHENIVPVDHTVANFVTAQPSASKVLQIMVDLTTLSAEQTD
jgi:hypothetical protein